MKAARKWSVSEHISRASCADRLFQRQSHPTQAHASQVNFKHPSQQTIMSASGSGSRYVYITPQDYFAQIKEILRYAQTHPKVAVLMVFDIDDTLKSSTGTGGITKAPRGLVDALIKLSGLLKNVFVMVATGRNPRDADEVFRGALFPTIAKDGSWIRFVNGQIKEFKFPKAEQFIALSQSILTKRATDLVESIPLGDAFGLSYPKATAGGAYGRDLAQFTELEANQPKDGNGRRDIVIYTHEYQTALEIIVQNGKHTKATGVEKIMAEIMARGFTQTVVVAHGNSSNDIPMLDLANRQRDFTSSIKAGYSFWIGQGSTTAKMRMAFVENLQEGLILSANWLATKVAEAGGSGSRSGKAPRR
jgi:hydroxymethylpyrimidine pyrophosphatase-like HAD family hydrolase